MTSNPLPTLCDILENGMKRIRLAAHPMEAIEPLLASGLLRRDGVVDVVACDCCDNCDSALVQSDHKTGTYGYRCPEAGWIPLKGDDLAAARLDLDAVCSELAKALLVRVPGPFKGQGTVRPIGIFELDDLQCFAYLAPRLHALKDLLAVRTEIAQRPFPVFGAVFVTARTAAATLALPRNHHLIALSDVAQFNAQGRIAFDRAALRSYLPRAEIKGSGRPTKHADTQAVIGHLIVQRHWPRTRKGQTDAITDAWHEVHPASSKVPAPTTIHGHLTKLGSWIEEETRALNRKDEN